MLQRKLLHKNVFDLRLYFIVLDMSISSCAILVCSDRCFNGESEDRSGKALEKIVREELDCQNTILKIVPGTCSRFWPTVLGWVQVWDRSDSALGQVRFRFGTALEHNKDDLSEIKNALLTFCDESYDLILTTGGTGFSSRDNTPEATKQILEKEANGIVIAIMVESLKITPHAMLSRAVAGSRDKSLIINLPGSSKGSTESLMAVIGSLPHAVDLLKNSNTKVKETHDTMMIKNDSSPVKKAPKHVHICPHKKVKTSIYRPILLEFS